MSSQPADRRHNEGDVIPPKLRLKIEANLADGSALYVLALEGLSIVAALRELSWQLAVFNNESFLDESEYATTLIEVLCPMAVTAHLLPPGAHWNSNATLRLHTKTRRIDGSDESEEVMLIEFHVHEIGFSHEKLYGKSPRECIELIEAYEEEAAIIRSLDGFEGDGAALLERLRVHMESGAVLARAQLFHQTVHRALMTLHCVYAEDLDVKRRIDEFATWLMRLPGEEGRLEQSLQRPSVDVPHTYH